MGAVSSSASLSIMVDTSRRLTVPSLIMRLKKRRALGGVVLALKFHLKGAMPLTESAPTRSCPARELSKALRMSRPTSSVVPFDVTFLSASISSTMV